MFVMNALRYASSQGTVVGPGAAGKWLVQVTLANGAAEIIETSSVIYDGAMKWTVQEFVGADEYFACVKELEAKFRGQGWTEHENFDGIVGFARFTDQWYVLVVKWSRRSGHVTCPPGTSSGRARRSARRECAAAKCTSATFPQCVFVTLWPGTE